MNVKFYRLLQAAFFSGLLVLPFVFWPYAAIPYELPRVWLFQRWVELIGILGVIALVSGVKPQKTTNSNLLFLLLVFFTWALVSSLFGVDPIKSIIGNYYRSDGILTLSHLVGLVLFLVLFWEKSWEKILFVTMSASSTLLAIWTIAERFRSLGVSTLLQVANSSGIGVSFGQPKFLGGYLLVALPFSVAMIQASQKQYLRLIWILAVFVQCAAIWFSGARSAVLGVFVFFCLSFILDRKLWSQKLFRIVMLIVISVLIGIGTTWYIRTKEPYSITAETHERIAIKGILAFLKRPIVGWGWANFDYAFAAVDWPHKFYDDVYVDKAHGNILEVLVTTGIIGFALYIGIIWKTLKRLLESYPTSKYILFSFLLFLFHSQTNVISISEEVIFWLIVGIIGSRDGVTRLTEKKLTWGRINS